MAYESDRILSDTLHTECELCTISDQLQEQNKKDNVIKVIILNEIAQMEPNNNNHSYIRQTL